MPQLLGIRNETHHDGAQCRFQKFAIGHVGPADASREGVAVAFDQYALLNSRLGTVGEV